MDLNETLRWILSRGLSLLIGTVVLLVIYRVGLSAIHRLVPTVINAQAAHLPSGSSSTEEVGKRILIQVEIADASAKETASIVERLMGKRPELRFQYIQENARFVDEDELDV